VSKDRVKRMKKLAREIVKKFSLNGVEIELFMDLIKQEINMPANQTNRGINNALMNFKKRSPVRRAYNAFQKARTGKVSWRSPKES